MADQAAAQEARPAAAPEARPPEPNPQVVRCLQPLTSAVRMWAAHLGIHVAHNNGDSIPAADLARAVATALAIMSNRPAFSNPNAVLLAAQLYVSAPPSARQSRDLATGYFDATLQGTPGADTWRRLSNNSMAVFATIEATNAGQESWAQIYAYYAPAQAQHKEAPRPSARGR